MVLRTKSNLRNICSRQPMKTQSKRQESMASEPQRPLLFPVPTQWDRNSTLGCCCQGHRAPSLSCSPSDAFFLGGKGLQGFLFDPGSLLLRLGTEKTQLRSGDSLLPPGRELWELTSQNPRLRTVEQYQWSSTMYPTAVSFH